MVAVKAGATSSSLLSKSSSGMAPIACAALSASSSLDMVRSTQSASSRFLLLLLPLVEAEAEAWPFSRPRIGGFGAAPAANLAAVEALDFRAVRRWTGGATTELMVAKPLPPDDFRVMVGLPDDLRATGMTPSALIGLVALVDADLID